MHVVTGVDQGIDGGRAHLPAGARDEDAHARRCWQAGQATDAPLQTPPSRVDTSERAPSPGLLCRAARAAHRLRPCRHARRLERQGAAPGRRRRPDAAAQRRPLPRRALAHRRAADGVAGSPSTRRRRSPRARPRRSRSPPSTPAWSTSWACRMSPTTSSRSPPAPGCTRRPSSAPRSSPATSACATTTRRPTRSSSCIRGTRSRVPRPPTASPWSCRAASGPSQNARTQLSAFALPTYDAATRAKLSLAVSKIGMPYVWGGETDGISYGQAHGGYDCSGFVDRVFGAAVGGRTTAAGYAGAIRRSQRIRLDDVRAGDLLFFGKAHFTSRATERQRHPRRHRALAGLDDPRVGSGRLRLLAARAVAPRRVRLGAAHTLTLIRTLGRGAA